MRGWIEVMQDAVPHKEIGPDGSLGDLRFEGAETVWRLTQAGWSVIDGTNRTAVLAMGFSALSVLMSIVGIVHPLIIK